MMMMTIDVASKSTPGPLACLAVRCTTSSGVFFTCVRACVRARAHVCMNCMRDDEWALIERLLPTYLLTTARCQAVLGRTAEMAGTFRFGHRPDRVSLACVQFLGFVSKEEWVG